MKRYAVVYTQGNGYNCCCRAEWERSEEFHTLKECYEFIAEEKARKNLYEKWKLGKFETKEKVHFSRALKNCLGIDWDAEDTNNFLIYEIYNRDPQPSNTLVEKFEKDFLEKIEETASKKQKKRLQAKVKLKRK